LNIIYLSSSFLPSKSANSVHVMNMCEAFENLGIKITLFGFKGEERGNIFDYYNVNKEFDIYTIKKRPIRFLGDLIASFKIKKIILNKFYNSVIYARNFYPLYLLKNKYKYIVESHILPENIIHKRIQKVLFKNKNFIKLVVISNILKEDYLKTFPMLKPEDIIVAHDAAKIAKIKSKKLTKKSGNQKVIGYVGSLFPGKGMEIISKLTYELPKLKFIIVGGNEEEVNYWNKKCNPKNTQLIGYVKQKDLIDYYNEFDIVLLPNQKDILVNNKRSNIGKWTSPLKLFEYMAYQKPIIASDLPVLREVLNENNSILCDPENVEEWVRAIKLLIKDEKLSKKIAENAYKDLINKYTWDKRAEKILDILYKELI